MFSEKDLENAKKVVSKCGCGRNQKNEDGGTTEDNLFLGLNPSQLLIIAGIISGALNVESVLVDRKQAIEIVLTGSLKRKTQLDRVMEQIAKMPFDQVMTAIMNNIT